MFTGKTDFVFVSVMLTLLATMAWGQDYPDTFFHGETHALTSEILQQDQTLFIYLPRNYNQSDQTYPVFYITDAPATSNLFHSLYTLHTITGDMPQAIVVGLSSDNREHNLHAEKGAATYLDFLANKVIPYIENQYRTKPFRCIAGHSLGGGFALYAYLNRPKLFNLCIAGSPYPLAVLAEQISNAQHPAGNSFLYCSIGGIEDIPYADFENFKTKYTAQWQQKTQYRFDYHEQENHISNIAVNFQNGLRWYYKDWKFVLPDSLPNSADTLLREHYQHWSAKVGYPVEVSQWDVIFPVMDQLARRGDFINAKKVLRYCLEIHPDSDQAYAFMARACISTGDMAAAKTNLAKALELNPENSFANQIKNMLDQNNQTPPAAK